jgi:hypothetical protein
MVRGEFAENPALDPIRPWLPDDASVVEAGYLVKSLDARARAVLSVLATRPHEPVRFAELGAATATSAAEVEHALARINTFAEALGFVPMVTCEKDLVSVSAPAAEVARQALRRRNS